MKNIKYKILKLLTNQKFILFFILFVCCIFFSLANKNFFDVNNLINLVRQSSFIIITASGATLLMMSGNFDLSTGSNVALSGLVYAMLCQAGVPVIFSILLGTCCGLIIGVINGTFVTKFKMPPFIVTLGLLYIVRGFVLIISDGKSVRTNLPPDFTILENGTVGPVPIQIILIAVFVIIFLVLEKKTLLGRYSLAIGGNSTAAFLSGINEKAIVFLLFVLVGGLAGFSGVMLASRIGAGDPNIAVGFEFDVIVAIILGGTSLAGGKGSVIGMLIGALIIASIGNGLDLLMVLSFWQSVIKGVILVLAVIINENVSLIKIKVKQPALMKA